MKSHTSGSSPTMPSTASISPRSIPRSPTCSSTHIRHATAARPSTSSSVSSRISRSSRARFSMLPPYSSVRSLNRRERKCCERRQAVGGVDVDEVVPGPQRALRPRPGASAAGRQCRSCSSAAPAPGRWSAPAGAQVPSAVGGRRGWRRSSRCERARSRPATHARAPARPAARASGCRRRPRAGPRRTRRRRWSGGSRPPRCTRPPSRPRPSRRASRRGRSDAGGPCRCSAAPGRTGCGP